MMARQPTDRVGSFGANQVRFAASADISVIGAFRRNHQKLPRSALFDYIKWAISRFPTETHLSIWRHGRWSILLCAPHIPRQCVCLYQPKLQACRSMHWKAVPPHVLGLGYQHVDLGGGLQFAADDVVESEAGPLRRTGSGIEVYALRQPHRCHTNIHDDACPDEGIDADLLGQRLGEDSRPVSSKAHPEAR